MKRVQLVILSDQLPAAYLPVAVLKPDAVVAVVTSEMAKKQKDTHFKALLQAIGYQVGSQLYFVQDMPTNGAASIRDWGLELMASPQWDGWGWDLNATGGTKLMALALAPLFDEDGHRVLYQDTQADRIEWILPHDLAPQAVVEQFNAPLHFRAYGATWRRAQSDDAAWLDVAKRRIGLARQLVRVAAQNENFIRVLNRAAADAVKRVGLDDRIVAARQTLPFIPKGAAAEVLKRCDELGVIAWHSAEPKVIEFNDVDGWRFISGGWLEEYAWHCAVEAGLNDVHCSVELTDDYDKKANLRNELDIVVQHRNRLLVAECKTAKMGEDSKDANIINKLDSVANHFGGDFATRLLLSALPLNHVTAANRQVHTQQRAQSRDIHVVHGADLQTLTAQLRHWSQRGQWPSDDEVKSF